MNETNEGAVFTEEVEAEGTGEVMEPIEADINEENTLSVDEDDLKVDAEPEDGNGVIDPNDPTNPQTMKQVTQLLKQMNEMTQIMQSQWMASVRELSLTDSHMKQLAKWNSDHKTEMPENISQKEKDEWDHLNGIDSITDEAIHEIFGDEHPIYGVDHSQTVDRIKGACQDYFAYLSAMREYRGVHDAYLELLDLEEDTQIKSLQALADAEEDEEKKAKMLKSVSDYYRIKNLGFLGETIDPAMKDRIINGLTNAEKIKYWIKRSQDKLHQLDISGNIILELSQFEKRFLEEKYHENSGVLLLYFIITCSYANMADKRNEDRTKIFSMVMRLDGFIRKTLKEETKEAVTANILAFEDQFIGLTPKTEEE